jgi:phage terminase small subunit
MSIEDLGGRYLSLGTVTRTERDAQKKSLALARELGLDKGWFPVVFHRPEDEAESDKEAWVPAAKKGVGVHALHVTSELSHSGHTTYTLLILGTRVHSRTISGLLVAAAETFMGEGALTASTRYCWKYDITKDAQVQYKAQVLGLFWAIIRVERDKLCTHFETQYADGEIIESTVGTHPQSTNKLDDDVVRAQIALERDISNSLKKRG